MLCITVIQSTILSSFSGVWVKSNTVLDEQAEQNAFVPKCFPHEYWSLILQTVTVHALSMCPVILISSKPNRYKTFKSANFHVYASSVMRIGTSCILFGGDRGTLRFGGHPACFGRGLGHPTLWGDMHILYF